MPTNLISIVAGALIVAAMLFVILRVSHARITDSGWFWLFVFSGMGLLGTLVIGPKYGHRQQRLETRFEARQQIDERAARLRAGQSSEERTPRDDRTPSDERRPRDKVDSDATWAEDPAGQPVQFTESRELQVPLTLLGSILGIAALLAGYMLVRTEIPKRRAASAAAEQTS